MKEDLARLAFASANSIAAVVLLVLAIVSLRRGPRVAYLRMWSLFCFLASLYTIFVTLAGQVSTREAGLTMIRLAMSFGSIAVFVFFHFSFSFTRSARRARWFMVAATVWIVSLQPLFWVTELILADVTKSEVSRFSPVAGPLMGYYGAFLAYGWGVPLFLFIRAFLRSSGMKRTQAAYMLVAFSILGISTTGSLLPSWTRSQTLVAAIPALLLPLCPLLITYAIVRHRLWDVRTIVHRTAGWLALSVLLGFPLYFVHWLVAPLLPELNRVEVAVWLSLLFLVGYMYLRAVKPKLDHWFQQRALDQRRELDRFERKMVALRGPGEVVKNLIETLERTLYPSGVSILYQRRDGDEWIGVARPEEDAGRSPDSVDLDNPFTRLLVEDKLAVVRSQIETDQRFLNVKADAEQYFRDRKYEVCLPLVQGGVLIGMVGLGEKRNLKPYFRGDLEFLDQLGAATSIGLSNALLFDEVDAQRRDLYDLTTHLEERVAERTGELEEANERLRDLDRLKSRFFANISHELRTPLSLVLAPVDSMLSGDVGEYSESQRQHLAGIQRNALQLMKLIDDLLDLSKLEETRLKLRLDRFDLASLVSRIADMAAPLAERKRIGLEVEIEDRPEIEADDDKLERAIVNLLSNALKFTGEGGRVWLAVGREDGNAWVKVRDDGVGIPAGELENIFDRFHQVDSSRMSGGTGIGLSLARELVELHDGRLRVESVPGEGSTFTVLVPCSADGLPDERIERRCHVEQVDELRREDDLGIPEWSDQIRASRAYRFLDIDKATERRVVPRREETGPKAARLLVVDDNPDVLRYLDQLLGERYELWHVQEGERALELLVSHRHDLVVSDVMMPGMSGMELCRRIKSDPRVQDTPVILLTARGGEESRIEGHGAGADQYLTKPFYPDELMAAIEAQLAGRVRRTEVAAHRRSVSLETLLAGLAHELRNACQQAGSAQTAAWQVARRMAGEDRDAALDERLAKMERISKRALDRVGVVVLSLQQYSHRRIRVPWVDIELDELVEREVGRLTEVEEKGVRLELSLDSGARVRGPHEELRQMVLNLVENAVQAVERGGRVRVETTALTGLVRLVVEDDGCGIPAADRDRIFDLFYSGKDPGKGIGLGLALVQRTVTDLGGTIKVESEEGEGTRFTLELPRVEPEGR